MTFRPRYSLLAFLLFTAFIAGGVKLWRGPHHVIDRSNPQMEDEYTYYRDWDGTKVVDGVRLLRYLDHIGKPAWVTVLYYRRGEKQNVQNIIKASVMIPHSEVEQSYMPPDMNKVELDQLIVATDRENESLKK